MRTIVRADCIRDVSLMPKPGQCSKGPGVDLKRKAAHGVEGQW